MSDLAVAALLAGAIVLASTVSRPDLGRADRARAPEPVVGNSLQIDPPDASPPPLGGAAPTALESNFTRV